MAPSLFDSPPKSFVIPRKSQQASNLRVAVAEKLFRSLPSHSDDVLTDYIVVLVCNGKNQHQARDDLSAFLGEECDNFVIWLWNHLSKRTVASGPVCCSIGTEMKSPLAKFADMTQKKSRCSHETSDFSFLKECPLEIPEFQTGTDFLKTTTIFRRNHGCCPLNVPADKERTKGLQINSHVVHEKFGLKEDEKEGESNRNMHSVATHISGVLCGSEQGLQSERQRQKTTKGNPCAALHQSSYIPEVEPVARNLQIATRENISYRPGFIRNGAAMNAEPGINRRRGSVWDRLGKPTDEEYTSTKVAKNRRGYKVSFSEDLNYQTKKLQDSRSSYFDHDARLTGDLRQKLASGEKDRAKISSYNHSSIYQKYKFNEEGSFDYFGKQKRKRHYGNVDFDNSSATFSEYEENIQDKYLEKQDSFPAKHDHNYSSDGFITTAKDIAEAGSVPTAKANRVLKGAAGSNNGMPTTEVVRKSPLPPGFLVWWPRAPLPSSQMSHS